MQCTQCSDGVGCCVTDSFNVCQSSQHRQSSCAVYRTAALPVLAGLADVEGICHTAPNTSGALCRGLLRDYEPSDGTTLSIRAVYWRCVRPLHLQLPRHDQVLPGGDNLPAPRHRLHGQSCLYIQCLRSSQIRQIKLMKSQLRHQSIFTINIC